MLGAKMRFFDWSAILITILLGISFAFQAATEPPSYMVFLWTGWGVVVVLTVINTVSAIRRSRSLDVHTIGGRAARPTAMPFVDPGPDLADSLLAGPRGRRLLLEYATESERLSGRAMRADSFIRAASSASYEMDPGKGTSVVMLTARVTGANPEPDPEIVTPEEVAERLARVELAEPTPQLFRGCLAQAVDNARYWQPPAGEDALAASDPMRRELRRIAEHLLASPYSAWWFTPADPESQQVVVWEDDQKHQPLPLEVSLADPSEALRSSRKKLIEQEEEAKFEQPADPVKCYSAEWWSRPSSKLSSTTRTLFDGSPVGLWAVEDGFNWKSAYSYAVEVPDGLRVYEIDSARAWVKLCWQFPMDCSARKRHDWYMTTGRTGRWAMPDWARVAERYDGVHLQVGAYLEAAGTAIPVDEETATVIAGWDPDTTYWFAPGIRYLNDPVRWKLVPRGMENTWQRC
ncbi:hypothetical protein U6G28_04625 [Actinomycetaceae bacterium MB13-C1-2]|nr:hypothetical protein U6G28_04625 [Actinomycetaceae bacterium MB13-C1-2]